MAKMTSKIKTATTAQSIINWNRWIAGAYAVQGLLLLLLAATRVYPVQTTYMANDTLSSSIVGQAVNVVALRHLFDLNVVCVAAAALFFLALGHGIIGTVYKEQYQAELKKRSSRLRWLTYGISAGLWFVVLALITGITDLTILLIAGLAGLAVHLVVLAIEQAPIKLRRLFFGVAGLVGILPWAAIAIGVWSANIYSNSSLSASTYGMLTVAFALCLAHALLLVLLSKKVGVWADYIRGERFFMMLQLLGVSSLTWLLYAGALQP